VPAAAKQGSTITIVPPTPCQTTTTCAGGTGQVLINGARAATVTSPVTPWLVGVPPVCVTVSGTVTGPGSSSVLVNGQPLAYLGSMTSAGPINGNCAPDVIVGA